MIKKKNSLAGRPPIRDEDKKRPDGLSNSQYERLQREANARGVDTRHLLRQIVDWYFTVLDTKRGDADINKAFDNIVTPSE